MKLPEDHELHAALTPEREDPQRLAQHIIRLLEGKITEEFGLTIQIGAELEFSVLPGGGHVELPPSMFAVPQGKKGNYSLSASVVRPPEMRDAWFPHSRRVNRSYHESQNPHTSWQQMEVVLTHQPTDASGKPVKNDAVTLARNIEALRHQIASMAYGHKPGREDVSAHMHHLRWKDFRRRYVDEVRFTPFIDHAFLMNGLHLNLGLVDQSGASFFADPQVVPPFSNGLGRFMEENLYLLGSSRQTVARWSTQYGMPSNYYKQFPKKPTKASAEMPYIENRLPPADTNPYYAVMLELAAVYHTLQHMQPGCDTKPVRTQDFSQLSPSVLYRQFHKGTQLRYLLDKLEPELGERFYRAIEQTPPGCEKTAQKKPCETANLGR